MKKGDIVTYYPPGEKRTYYAEVVEEIGLNKFSLLLQDGQVIDAPIEKIYTPPTPIQVGPPANTGYCWEWHAAPEWETQRFELSLWATLELRNTAWIIESDAKEVAFKLGLI